MCAKDDLIRRKGPLSTSTQTWEVLFQTYDEQLAGELATAESVTAKDSNHVDIFSSDFAFSFAITISIRLLMARGNNILSLIAFIISYCLFADKLNIQQSLLDRATVVPIIISVDKTQLLLISGDVAVYTLLAEFIPTTKIRDPLLKKNAAKSRILLACADGRIRQCYLTICAILKHYNFNIHVSLATDTLHLLLKGLVMKMLDFMQDMLDDIYPGTPFALHFIRAVCDLVTLAQYKRALERINIFKEEFRVYRRTLEEEKNFNYPKALDSICTRANSEAYYITIVKQFYSMINKKDEVAANIAISDFIYAAAVQEFKHRDNRRQSRTVIDGRVVAQLHLILTIIDYTCYDKDGKYIAYIGAFSEVLLFNNNRQIDNTTRILSTLQAFKFYNLSTIIRLVHLVLRDLPDLTTRTTMSYYVNNYIN
ncbi:hypothetical protein HBI63_239690 [Parastagonospora nodorum]|nr:hypothetical protein HBI63_239690 [Parastagonospora nodorum]